MNKTEKYLSRALLPMAVGVSALCWLAWRPCELSAQASTETSQIRLPEVQIVGEVQDQVPVVSVEDLPRVSQTPAKHTAGISRKSAKGICTSHSPEYHCWVHPMRMGTVGDLVQECDCSH